LRDGDALREQLLGIDPHQPFVVTQMTLTVRVQMPAGLCNGDVEADSGQRILQPAALAPMHVHITTGNEPQAPLTTERLQSEEVLPVRSLTEQLDCDPGTIAKLLAQPARLILPSRFVQRPRIRRATRAGSPQNEALL